MPINRLISSRVAAVISEFKLPGVLFSHCDPGENFGKRSSHPVLLLVASRFFDFFFGLAGSDLLSLMMNSGHFLLDFVPNLTDLITDSRGIIDNIIGNFTTS